MPLNEADTRIKLIDPALHARGWTEDLIRREQAAQPIALIGGKAQRYGVGRADYVLRVLPPGASYPVAVAIIEAKAEHLLPGHGLQQGKEYASGARLNVPFVFSSNGHQFVAYDHFTGQTQGPLALADFPTPQELLHHYEVGKGFSLSNPLSRPLLTPYTGGDSARRYYQDAAIRAVFEAIAQGRKRALLSLATGTGKTSLSVHLLKRLSDAKQLSRALFVCDRDELRTQGLGALQRVFGSDAQAVTGSNAQKNARVLVATYHTLGIEDDGDAANFLTTHYPENFFSHIVIDECHRSAWGKWHQVLTRNSDAVQIGLTATPRQIELPQNSPEAENDRRILADNLRYFGPPVYEYSIGQAMDDGYLALCEIERRKQFLNQTGDAEAETPLVREELASKTLYDARTGEVVEPDALKKQYAATSFERSLVLPDRVRAMCDDLFQSLVASGGPKQKTIVFCASDSHADDVANLLNNLYAAHCTTNGLPRADVYAFKCTSKAGGADIVPDFKASSKNFWVATTVDLLSTGVDVPALQNVVFFRYLSSPITFSQMVGRGTRIDVPTSKLSFCVYDYTNATRLFGREFLTRATAARENGGTASPAEPTFIVAAEGVAVQVTDAGKQVLLIRDGKATPVSAEVYRQEVAARLTELVPSLAEFREKWVTPDARRRLLADLPDGANSANLARTLADMDAFDLYDVLAELGWGMVPRTRQDRADAFGYKHADWLGTLPAPSASALRAVATLFGRAGTDGLESPHLVRMPELKSVARSLNSALLSDAKARIFAT